MLLSPLSPALRTAPALMGEARAGGRPSFLFAEYEHEWDPRRQRRQGCPPGQRRFFTQHRSQELRSSPLLFPWLTAYTPSSFFPWHGGAASSTTKVGHFFLDIGVGKTQAVREDKCASAAIGQPSARQNASTVCFLRLMNPQKLPI
ncbi:unnamed protein product, partial [Ectocarpus sp. 13 AM-2016]